MPRKSAPGRPSKRSSMTRSLSIRRTRLLPCSPSSPHVAVQDPSQKSKSAEPVTPSETTDRIAAALSKSCSLRLGGVERAQQVVRGDDGEQQRVDAVEDAAVRGEQAPRVLDLHVALQPRFEQVAERCGDGDDETEEKRLRNRER